MKDKSDKDNKARIYNLKNPEDIDRLIADIPEYILPVYIYQNPNTDEIVIIAEKPLSDEQIDTEFAPVISSESDIIDPNNPDDEIIFDDFTDDDLIMFS